MFINFMLVIYGCVVAGNNGLQVLTSNKVMLASIKCFPVYYCGYFEIDAFCKEILIF